jgi:hypothetical protein
VETKLNISILSLWVKGVKLWREICIQPNP